MYEVQVWSGSNEDGSIYSRVEVFDTRIQKVYWQTGALTDMSQIENEVKQCQTWADKANGRRNAK